MRVYGVVVYIILLNVSILVKEHILFLNSEYFSFIFMYLFFGSFIFNMASKHTTGVKEQRQTQ